jgi:hypothetical protein
MTIETNELVELEEPAKDSSEFFHYKPLDDGRPPDVTVRFRLARRYEDDEEGAERLRVALPFAYDQDNDRLDCLIYIVRPERGEAVWALERWSGAGRRLEIYSRDRTSSPRARARCTRPTARTAPSGSPRRSQRWRAAERRPAAAGAGRIVGRPVFSR